MTLPPTDGIGAQSGARNETWRLALLLLAGGIATLLVLTPAKRKP